jgi:hypothetical protein
VLKKIKELIRIRNQAHNLTCFFSFQLIKENLQNVTSQQYHTHAIGHKEHCGSSQDNSLPLCFSSFKLLKKSFDPDYFRHEMRAEI